MAYTRKQKAADVAKGAATGAAANGAIVGTIAVASKALPVVAKVAGAMLSAPVVATVVGGMAVAGATRAYAKTGSAKDAATGAVAGSLGIFPAFEKKPAPQNNEPRIILAADDGKTIKQMKDEDAKLARANRNLARAERDLKRIGVETSITPKDSDIATPADLKKEAEAKMSFAQRMRAKAEHAIEGAIFGHDKPKDVIDPYDQRRAPVQQKLKTLNKELSTEVGRGGVGPKTASLEKSIKEASGELAAIDKEERRANEGASQMYRSIGAVVGGAAIGGIVGGAIKKAAHSAAASIEGSLAKTAQNAGKMAASNKRGVIAGTLEGDKAAASIAAAKAAATAPVVSAGAAYALPAVSAGHGAVAYGMAEHLDKQAAARGEERDPIANILRTEGTAAIAAGVFAGKAAAAARALRPRLSPVNAAKLGAAEARLAREARKGPAGVAQAKGQKKVAIAKGDAAVATANAKGASALASTQAERKVTRAQATTAVATVKAGRDLATAKVRAASSVERAEINAKAANSRAIQRENVDVKYKDVWTDKLGRVYHRKDQAVRTRKGKAVANDNAVSARKGA